MPVWGVWDDRTFRFGFSCGQLTRKAYNIRANPQVVVTGADVVEAISIEGIASEVSDGASLENWVSQYISKYGAEAPEADFFRQYAFFEVAAEDRVRGHRTRVGVLDQSHPLAIHGGDLRLGGDRVEDLIDALDSQRARE